MSNNYKNMKFRIWSEKYKTYGEYLNYFVLFNGELKLFDSEGDIVDPEDGEVLERCVGLKDKNGKYVYENDIIKFHYKGKDRLHFIRYSEDQAMYVSQACEESPSTSRDCVNNTLGLLPNFIKEAEVVGNMHQELSKEVYDIVMATPLTKLNEKIEKENTPEK